MEQSIIGSPSLPPHPLPPLLMLYVSFVPLCLNEHWKVPDVLREGDPDSHSPGG